MSLLTRASSAVINVAARGRATKTQAPMPEGSDSEAEQGMCVGPSLKGVLQQMVQQGVDTQDGDR